MMLASRHPDSLSRLVVVDMAGYAPVKHLTLKRIPDSAHFIMWDQPQRFQQEVKAFLPAP